MAVENQGPLVAIAVFHASWAMTAKAPRKRRVATMRRWRGMGFPSSNPCPVWRYKCPSSVIAGDNHPASGARLRSDFCHRGGRIAVSQARLPEPFMRPGEDPVSMTRQEQMV